MITREQTEGRETRHTPTPWRYYYHAIGNQPFALIGADGKDAMLATEDDEGQIVFEFAHQANHAFVLQAVNERATDKARIALLEGALVPLMLLKSQNCDGQIGWRGQLEAKAGYILVKDILQAERVLEGTTIAEDAKTYTEHKWHEEHNAGVINRPQGPCDCESCRRIRTALAKTGGTK